MTKVARVRAKFDPKTLASLEGRVRRSKQQIEQMDNLLREVGQEVETLYLKPMLRRLRIYPPRRKQAEKAMWKNAKQWRYMMLLWSRGDIDLPTKRTGYLARAWRYKVKQNRTSLSINVSNDAPYQRYVSGDFGISQKHDAVRRYLKPIQPIHRGRWTPAHEIITPALLKSKAHITRRVNEYIQSAVESIIK